MLREGEKRKLVALDEIDITRDVMDVEFFLKSDMETEDIKYFLNIKNWTESSFEISINFTDPMIISQGEFRDECKMVIKNPYLFVSKETGEKVDSSKVKIYQTLPR